MLFGVMNVLATIFYWTWFIWPFVLFAGLANGIKELLQPNPIKPANTFNSGFITASLSMLFIVAGLVYSALY